MERVTLSLKEFRDIKFTNKGIPQLMISIFCFLTQMEEEDFLVAKFDQLYPGIGKTMRHNFNRRATVNEHEINDKLTL